MRIAFIRDDARGDSIQVTRPDGSEARWSAAGGPGLPHDLVHLVVEHQLGLGQGFWGLVAAGVDFRRVNEAASRSSPLDDFDTTELMQSEAIAGALQIGLAVPDLGADDLHGHAEAFAQGRRLPADVTPEAMARLIEQTRARAAEWRSLAPRGTLVVECPCSPAGCAMVGPRR